MVVDGSWGLVRLLVDNRSDGSSQDLATSCFWESVHEQASNQTAESSNISSNFEVDILGNLVELLWRPLAASSENDESESALASDLVVVSNDS